MAVDAEERQAVAQRLGLGRHLLRRAGELLGGGRVALGHLVDPRHGAGDLTDARRLLVRGRRDLLHQIRGLADRRHQLGQQLARALGDFDAPTGQVADLLGGRLAALGQLAHLVGHHGEAAPVLAGARRLDGGVERQQVGLVGDLLDDRDLLGDRPHRLERLLDRPAAVLGRGAPGQRHLLHLFAVRGVLGDRGGHLLEAGRGLLDRGRLLAGALRQGLRGSRDLGRGGGQGVHAATHAGDRVGEPIGHRGEGVAQRVLLAARPNVDRQVAAGDRLGHLGHLPKVDHHRPHRGQQPTDLVARADLDPGLHVAPGEPVGGLERTLDRARQRPRQEERERQQGENAADAEHGDPVDHLTGALLVPAHRGERLRHLLLTGRPRLLDIPPNAVVLALHRLERRRQRLAGLLLDEAQGRAPGERVVGLEPAFERAQVAGLKR